MPDKAISELLAYAVSNQLMDPRDEIYAANQILALLKEDGYEKKDVSVKNKEIQEILDELLDFAVSKGLISDSITERDLLDASLMNCVMERPKTVEDHFYELYKEDPKKATDWFYDQSKKSNYIREDRIRKDEHWTAPSRYGELEISINLSKPEKDPKAIAAAKTAKQTAYPKCQLCMENEGYAGRLDHPGRANHRIITLTINDHPWGFQYSPYVYFNEHCIVLNSDHTPMAINRATFEKLFGFVKQFPHYMLGSNADLPIVGGSILSHDHYQGGNHEFPMAKAKVEIPFEIPGYEDVEAGILYWPMSVIRLRHEDEKKLIDLSEHILNAWRNYTDEEVMVLAETDGEPHNTITPIVRKRNGKFEIDLVLRNNLTTKEHPLGLYHPHEKLHHIKKENIGLIEVMGLAILPARLKKEMAMVREGLLEGKDLRALPETEKHADWAEEVKARHPEMNEENAEEILNQEIGLVFEEVLEDAGVFKADEKGREAFKRFLSVL